CHLYRPERVGSPARYDGMARAQKWPAETFERITRTSHEPGNRLHTSCAMQVPIPRLRYLRITKNSALPRQFHFQTVPNSSGVTAKPANGGHFKTGQRKV